MIYIDPQWGAHMKMESFPLRPDELGAMIVDQMLDAAIFVDRDGVIRLWNRGAEVLFGYTRAEAVGSSLDLIIPERFRLPHTLAFRHAVRTGRLRFQGQVMTTRSNHKYGCRLYVDFSFGLLKDAQGDLVGVFAVGRDATARHMGELATAAQAQ
jgi:PAS domain S-box-containing protein